MVKQTAFSISLVIAFFIISCNNGSQNVSEKSESKTTNENRLEKSFSATFSGTTPCADCPGIKTTVSFNPDSTFIENMEYLERNTSFSDTGKWRISDTIITVSFPSKKTSPERFFKIQSDSTIAMLDGDKKEIEGALEKYYVLKKLVK
ncbi:MAG TPA: copper resistance protein NlpE [Hanamia sp.]|nr:copper resistance protein NlpE [Hanamia sp.]